MENAWISALHGVVSKLRREKGGHAKIKDWRGNRLTNPSGSDNLLWSMSASFVKVNATAARSAQQSRFRGPSTPP